MSERVSTREVVRSAAEIGGVALASIFLAGTASYLTFSDGNVDLLGDRHQTRSDETIEDMAREKVEGYYAEASSSERYAMLFLNNGGEHVSIGRLEGGNGVLGALDVMVKDHNVTGERAYIGQGCLAGTSYDTLPSVFSSRGIFHRVEGEISAIAAVNRTEDGLLSIIPAATNAAPLQFVDSDEGLLRPANQQSEDILETYGCEPTRLYSIE